jgi:hypothetical protein
MPDIDGALKEMPFVRPVVKRSTDTLTEFPPLNVMKFPADSLHMMLLSAFHIEY